MRRRAYLVVPTIGLAALVFGAGAFAYTNQARSGDVHAATGVERAARTVGVRSVDLALPSAHATVWRMQSLNIGRGTDAISWTATTPGFRQWRASINNNDQRPGAAPVTGPTINLDGYDHGRWTFSPDPGTGPWSVGPGPDLGQGTAFEFDTFNGWNPTTQQPTSQVVNEPVTTGFDAARSFDTTTIPSGGGDQVVTVTLTLRAPIANGGWLHLNVNPNNGPTGGATVVGDQITTSLLTHGELSWLNNDAQGVHWNIGNPTMGETYVLTVRVRVPNAGSPFPYKAQVWVSSDSPTGSPGDGGVSSTTIPDALLGGTWTFGSSGVADWQRTITDAVQVGFAGIGVPALTLSLDQPAVTVPAGRTFAEHVTVQALTGLTGNVCIGLSGPPDANGSPTPQLQGIWWSSPAPNVTITGADPVSTAIDFHVDRSVAPGRYTTYLFADCLGAPAVLAPIALTVTPAQAAAMAQVMRNQGASLPAETDSVLATQPYAGSRQFGGQISNGDAIPVTAPSIGLDGYDASRWTFTPDPGPPPYSVGPGSDLGQGQSLWLDRLNGGWDNQANRPNSQVEATVSTGFDATRSFDTTTIPAGGGDQTVAVSITPRDDHYSGVNVIVTANDRGGAGAAIDTSSITTSAPGAAFGQLDESPQQVSWSLGNVSSNQTYTLTLRIHVQNSSSSPIPFKPRVNVGGSGWTQLSPVDGASRTTIADSLLGGTWTFASDAPIDWSRSLTDGAWIGLAGIPAPRFATSLSDPAPTVPAGWALSETLTITPLDGFSGTVNIGLCGTADPQEWSPPPQGFQQNGPGWNELNVSGTTTSPPLEIDIDPSVAPGEYTLYLCLGTDGPPVAVPIHVTVTAPGPTANADISASSQVTLPASIDRVDAATPFGGTLNWSVGVNTWNLGTGAVPGVTVDLPTGRGDFQPPVEYPLHVGPQDVTRDNGLYLPLGATPLPGLTLGMDVTRAAAGGDWAVAAGGVQTVTITVTPRRQENGGLDLSLRAGNWDGPAYGTLGTAVTSGANPDESRLDQSGGGLQWSIYNPEVGQTYTLTVPITATVSGRYKPDVQVSIGGSGSSSAQVGTTVSYSDPELGGTATFSAAETIQWWIQRNRTLGVDLRGVAPAPTPPPPEVTVESPVTTDEGVPLVYNRTPTTFTRDTTGDCVGNKPVQAVRLTLHPEQGNDVVVPLVPTGPGEVWSAEVTPGGVHGYATLTFDVTCSDNSTQAKDGGAIFIDPSGTIVDACTQAPVAGATATLQTETADGVFEPPLAGSFVPAVNPETTGADGSYGWDVLAGLWRVHVEAPGYEPADGPVLTIPPAVTDLAIELSPVGGCDTAPPVIAPHATVPQSTGDYRGAIVQYVPPTATDDRDGVVPVTCWPAPGSRFPLGTTAVGCTARDAAGNQATSAFAVAVKLDVDAAFTALTADIRGSTVKNGLQQELATKLTDAAKELGKTKPNVDQTCHKLDEFDRTLAKAGEHGLTAAQATIWRDWARAIATAIGC